MCVNVRASERVRACVCAAVRAAVRASVRDTRYMIQETSRLGLVVTKSTNLIIVLRLIVHSKQAWYQNDLFIQ